jgi:parallel beta-helix repeat protein
VVFEGNYILDIRYNCSIVAEGTASEPILFTSGSGSPFPGSWTWITFNASPGSSFEHCVFEYGQIGLRINNSSFPITRCEFRHCSVGIQCGDSSPMIEDCDIHDNGSTGIALLGRLSAPTIHGCNIYNNAGGWNIHLTGYEPGDLVIIDAENNWWGTDIEAEIEFAVSHDVDDANTRGHVDYDPWLHEVPVEPVTWGRLKALFAD